MDSVFRFSLRRVYKCQHTHGPSVARFDGRFQERNGLGILVPFDLHFGKMGLRPSELPSR
jgi:hypothetical protein